MSYGRHIRSEGSSAADLLTHGMGLDAQRRGFMRSRMDSKQREQHGAKRVGNRDTHGERGESGRYHQQHHVSIPLAELINTSTHQEDRQIHPQDEYF